MIFGAFVILSSCNTLKDMIAKSWEQEVEIELRSKRKSVLVQSTEGLTKKPKTIDSRDRGHQGPGHCGKCGKPYDGVCRSGGIGCFKCGEIGHSSRDCPWEQVQFVFTASRWAIRRSNS